MSLGQSERAAARADAQGTGAGNGRICHGGGRFRGSLTPAQGGFPMVGVPWVASAGAAQYSPPAMKVLGIETSCDETAAAVVTAERAVLADLEIGRAHV